MFAAATVMEKTLLHGDSFHQFLNAPVIRQRTALFLKVMGSADCAEGRFDLLRFYRGHIKCQLHLHIRYFN